MLALVVNSDETDLSGSNGGSAANTVVYMAYDPGEAAGHTPQYKWLKVMTGVYERSEADGFKPQVYFSPDGSKVLATLWLGTRWVMTFFDADTGEYSASDTSKAAIYRSICCEKLTSKQALAMNNSGSLIVFITRRTDTPQALVTLNGVKFDLSSGFSLFTQFPGNDQNEHTANWESHPNNIAIQKYSLLISPDEAVVITFSTSKSGTSNGAAIGLSKKVYCRMDVWRITSGEPNMILKPYAISEPNPNPSFSKGSVADTELKQCLFPAIHTELASSTPYIVSVITEYNSGSSPYKAGLLRTYLDSGYSFLPSQDD